MLLSIILDLNICTLNYIKLLCSLFFSFPFIILFLTTDIRSQFLSMLYGCNFVWSSTSGNVWFSFFLVYFVVAALYDLQHQKRFGFPFSWKSQFREITRVFFKGVGVMTIEEGKVKIDKFDAVTSSSGRCK